MTERSDVVVIGGGLAGCMAALSAAQADSRATVRLVSSSESTLRAATGLVDVLGYTPDGDGPLTDPFEAIPDLPAGHPYATVGVEAVREALATFDQVVGDAYRGEHTDLNALVPTAGGAGKPTARYPASVAAGLAARTDDMLIVGFDRVTSLDAHLMADQLQALGVPFRTTGVDVRFPLDVTAIPPEPRIAAALDVNERVPGPERADPQPIRSALADAIFEYHEFQDRVGLPAVLGRTHHRAIRDTIADRLDAEVFEIPLEYPSIPGQRLATLLADALDRRDVTVTQGRVTDVRTSAGSVDAVVVDRGDETEPVGANAVVLATGGLAGGGIVSDQRTVREPLLDCHVEAPADRDAWSAATFFGDHRFARFGLRTDDGLRPLAESGDPEFDNLRAAGAVLGGYDFAAEKSGGGVSLATGHVAGLRAVESV